MVKYFMIAERDQFAETTESRVRAYSNKEQAIAQAHIWEAKGYTVTVVEGTEVYAA